MLPHQLAERMSLRRQLVLNSGAVLLQKGIIALQHLLLVPFFIASWGAAVYGEWLTLSAVPAALAFCNLGLGSAAANTFVLRFLDGDVNGAQRAMRAGQLLLTVVVGVGVLVALPGLWWLGQSGVMGALQVHGQTALLVVALLAAASLVSFFDQLNDGWFRAARCAHVAIAWDAGTALVRIGVFVVLLVAGKPMVWLAAAELVLSTTSTLGLRLLGCRLLPQVRPSAARLVPGELRWLFGKGLAFMMEPVRRSIYLEGTILVTRVVLGAEAVAMLGTLRTLANSVGQLYNAVQAIIFPELQHALAQRAMASAQRLFQLALGTSVALTGAGVLGLALAGPWAYAHWTAGQLSPPGHAWWLLLAGVVANACWWPAAAAFRAVNQPERYAIVGVIASIIAVGLAASCAGPLGIAGPLVGLLTMELLMAVYVLPTSCQIVGQRLSTLPRDILDLRHGAMGLIRELAKRGGIPQPARTPHQKIVRK